MNKRNQRESGIELLRIIAAMGVIILHYNDGKAFNYVSSGSAQQMILFFLESMTICAVDLFIIISGYFLSGSQKRSLVKPFELIFQLIIMKEAIYLVNGLISKSSITMHGVLNHLIPNQYFVILYCALYLVSSFINLSLKHLKQNPWKILLIVMLCVFSLWNTVVDLGEEIIGREIKGISTISRLGGIQGFNIMNFILAYIIGAWLRYGTIPQWMQEKKRVIPAWIACIIMIFLWSIATEKLTRLELRSAWVYHNPLVLFSGLLLFQLFRNIHFHSSVINRLAGASFTCFLIHNTLLKKAGIQQAVNGSPLLMVGHIIACAIVIYLISWIVYEVYHFITKKAIQQTEKWRLFKYWSIDES